MSVCQESEEMSESCCFDSFKPVLTELGDPGKWRKGRKVDEK